MSEMYLRGLILGLSYPDDAKQRFLDFYKPIVERLSYYSEEELNLVFGFDPSPRNPKLSKPEVDDDSCYYFASDGTLKIDWGVSYVTFKYVESHSWCGDEHYSVEIPFAVILGELSVEEWMDRGIKHAGKRKVEALKEAEIKAKEEKIARIKQLKEELAELEGEADAE